MNGMARIITAPTAEAQTRREKSVMPRLQGGWPIPNRVTEGNTSEPVNHVSFDISYYFPFVICHLSFFSPEVPPDVIAENQQLSRIGSQPNDK